jgi:1-acyl-sn-glycerol-3-phosphate acyltransferase
VSRGYRWAASVCRGLVRIFFRRVDVTGLEHIPESGGGLIISWHPNGLVDPGLILTHFPRQIIFGARHGLFKWPLLGWLMRRIGTVPIYRKEDVQNEEDDSKRRDSNRESLDALARAITEGHFTALFPEGLSHDEPHPLELKTGAARLYYRARELMPAGGVPPIIIPVGLHYDKKAIFGSNALVAFHPPVDLEPELAEPPGREAPKVARHTQYRKLTSALGRVLNQVVHATASWEFHHLMHRARKLVRAERAHRAGVELDRPGMVERVLGFARLWSAYNVRVRTHPDEVEQLTRRIQEYDEELRALGIQDHELDGSPRLASPWLAVVLFLQLVLVYFFLPPILLLGYIANLPTFFLLGILAKLVSKSYKDEASVKVLVGSIAFPLTWLVVAFLVGWGQILLHSLYPTIPNAPILTGVVAFVLSAVGGVVALHYQRLVRETMRAIRVRFTRTRRSEFLGRLRAERARLFDQLMRLAEGLDLPGTVSADGRILAKKSTF